MEYLVLFLAFLFLGAIVFARGLWDDKKQRRRQREKLREAFGRKAVRTYADGEFHGIPRYFEKHRDGFFLDDITWNDLNLDEIFRQMNTTGSSAGQEYLYAMLRKPSFSEKELEERETLMAYFTEHEEERLRLQLLYGQMGRTGKYSLYDYLDYLEDLGERKCGLQILLDLLFLPAVALTGFSAQVGIVALLLLLICNISTYLKDKGAIEPYLISFRYILGAVSAAEKLCREKIPVLEPQQQALREILRQFKKLKREAKWGMRSMGGGENPIGVVMDYVNMIFHFDILAFNGMLHQVRSHAEEVDALLTITGRIDALIAAAGYRESLPGWCLPVFARGSAQEKGAGADMPCLVMKNMYHPLLAEPVKNDITACGGVLLTGSNASGKSTFLKAAALNAIFSQTIHACCADFYQGCFFRTMTSMALRDDLGSGESYYIVEIKSLKRILEAAAEPEVPVLCFVDEVLRGTNTVERIAASTQILKSLCRPGVCCFAATHDIELTGLLQKEYDNYHFEEEITDGDIHFPYRLMPGKAGSRNAIRLLSIMGYEEELIAAAEGLAEHFVKSGKWEDEVCWK